MTTTAQNFVFDTSSLLRSLALENVVPPVSSETVTPTASIAVPRDVASKFEVTSVNESIEELIRKKISEETIEAEEAFYFVDLGTVLKKHQEWVEYLPRVKPYYAVKCNNNMAIVKTLANCGVNFDCASKGEIAQILGCGVSASRIIYANPCKMKSHIAYAKSSDVDLMTFDNAQELHKIKECFPEARLILRIITDDSNSVCRFSTKFGAPLPQCSTLLALAKELELNVVGISFHVGSGCMSTTSFAKAIRSAYDIFQEGERHGFQFNILDLGGGWPGTNDGVINFPEIADCIRPIIDDLFPASVQVIAEPGRYYVAASHTLAVNVFAKRSIVEENGEKRFLYYVNDGVYQSFNCIFFDHLHPTPLVLDQGERTETYKCTMFGPTCDSLDKIAEDIRLPELETGEWVYFKNMGAYTVAAASPFNGFKERNNTFYIESPLE